MRHSTNCQACSDLAADSMNGALLGELSSSDDLAMKMLYIKQLTVGEKVALVKIARSCARVASYAYEDLIREAFVRVLRSQLTRVASVRTIFRKNAVTRFVLLGPSTIERTLRPCQNGYESAPSIWTRRHRR
jgi:hypothetical protein